MASKFDLGETVIASIEVKDVNDALQDPVTSMKIEINRAIPNYANVVASTDMTKDSTGKYHYDCQTSAFVAGTYEVIYTATDSTRITKEKETFILS